MVGAAISLWSGIKVVRAIDRGVRSFNLTFGCATATAHVVEIFKREDGSEDPIAFYQFRALNGRPYFGEIGGASLLEPGLALKILYNPSDPRQHRLAVDPHSFAEDVFSELFIVFFWGVFFYVGVMVALRGAVRAND